MLGASHQSGFAVGARVRSAALRRLRGLAAGVVEVRRPRPPDAPASRAEFRVLFVCYGNICRSAMAQGILRSKLVDAGLAGRVGVDSAGTSNENAGRRADPRARLALARHGGSIRDLRARGLADEDFETFDLILVMDESNRREALRRTRTAGDAAKVHLVLEYVGGGEVPDPVHGTRADFERTYVVLDRACDAVVAAIAARMRAAAPAHDASLPT